MQFRNDEQLALVCQAICDIRGISSSLLWLPQGPTIWTRDILLGYRYGGSRPGSSRCDQIIFLLACAHWDTFCSEQAKRLILREKTYFLSDSHPRDATVDFDEVLEKLDSKNIACLGELFVASTEGPEAVDRWLQKFSSKRKSGTCPRCDTKISCQSEVKTEFPVSSLREIVEYFTHKCGNCDFSETYDRCLASQSENASDLFDPVNIEPLKTCPLCSPIVK